MCLVAVYQELVGAMAKRGVRRNAMAAAVGISTRTLYAKLKGETDFTLSEANAIHTIFFSDMNKDELFTKEIPQEVKR